MQARAVAAGETKQKKYQRPDSTGRYGTFGGRYVPETLIPALDELQAEYTKAMADPKFKVRPDRLYQAWTHASGPRVIGLMREAREARAEGRPPAHTCLRDPCITGGARFHPQGLRWPRDAPLLC